MAKKKRSIAASPPQLAWVFDPGTPTDDFFEKRDLTRDWDLQEAVEDFIYMLEHGNFFRWEAVVCEEQGLPLTRRQKKELEDLINFDETEGDRVLYIDEMPRPSQPWYEILKKIVPHLVIAPFDTSVEHDAVKCDGWDRLVACVQKHGVGLSLPDGASLPLEAVPAGLRHQLALQFCFNDLDGLGETESATLQTQPQRVDWFLGHLRERKETAEYLDLTPESLLSRVILPARDRPVFLRLVREKLEMPATGQQLADYL
jgi:hypothetical protein